MDHISQARSLYKSFWLSNDRIEKYNTPFPIGVFGTLRRIPTNQGNAHVIHVREPVHHCKAFLPHFSSSGLSLNFKENASCIMELYFHDPADWPTVIEKCDRLESFSPSANYQGREEVRNLCGYYHRTLMEVKILPDDYANDLFNRPLRSVDGWFDDRDLKIPTSDWNQFVSVPAWVYSTFRANDALIENESIKVHTTSPMLWDGL